MSGGVEREVLDIAEGLVKNNYHSFVASSGGRLVSQLYQSGSRHLDLPLSSKNPITILNNVLKLRKLVKFHNIDIIHAQSRAPAWSSYLAAKLSGCRFMTTIHGAHSVTNDTKRLYNSIMTKGDKVIAVSEYIAEYAKNNYIFDHSKLSVVHCGVNIDKFNFNNIDKKRIVDLARNLHIPMDKPIIMLPGRLSRNKGHLFLLKAIKALPPKSVTCLFVGDDHGHLSYREELQTKINEYNLDKQVIITSNVSDMPAIYALSDIVACVSTKPEAFGLVSIEAQSMGRMVIANNMGGIKETIIDGETGWLIEPNNLDALIEKIMYILSLNLDKRLEYAQRARTHIENNFSLATMQKKIISIYHNLLDF